MIYALGLLEKRNQTGRYWIPKIEDGLFDELIHVYEILACLFGLEGEVFEVGSDNLMLNQNASAGTISYKNRHIFGSILIELVSKIPFLKYIYLP